MDKWDFGMDSLIDNEFTECMNMCRTEKGKEGKMERDRKKDKAECDGRIFEERGNIWQKNSEGKTVKGDAKLRCNLAPAIGKRKDNQNQAILLLPPPPLNPHTHPPPRKYISTLIGSEGKIFVGSIWFENNVHSSLLRCPSRNKQGCSLPQSPCVCVCDLSMSSAVITNGMNREEESKTNRKTRFIIPLRCTWNVMHQSMT